MSYNLELVYRLFYMINAIFHSKRLFNSHLKPRKGIIWNLRFEVHVCYHCRYVRIRVYFLHIICNAKQSLDYNP